MNPCPHTLQRAKTLRAEMTSPERLLWRAIRARTIGLKFRRQHPLGPYILDFFCHEKRIGIEIDGDTHVLEKQIHHDRIRAEYLKRRGIRVLRFTNADVRNNLEGVVDEIIEFASPSPGPSP